MAFTLFLRFDELDREADLDTDRDADVALSLSLAKSIISRSHCSWYFAECARGVFVEFVAANTECAFFVRPFFCDSPGVVDWRRFTLRLFRAPSFVVRRFVFFALRRVLERDELGRRRCDGFWQFCASIAIRGRAPFELGSSSMSSINA